MNIKQYKKKGSIIKNKLKEKKEENNEHNNFGINELKNKIEVLKSKKDKILFKLNKERKINEDLMKTNKEKKNLINKLKNIYFKDFDNKQNDEIEIDDLSGINILLNNS